MTTTHSIHPVSSPDLPTLAQFLQESKLSLTINRLLFKDWPNETAQQAVYTHAVETGFQNPAVESFKVVDDEAGLIVGHLVLSRKRPAGTEAPSSEKGKGSPVPDGVDGEVFAAVEAAIAAIDTAKDVDHLGEFAPRNRLASDLAKPCKVLTHLFVKPAYRRRGIGSRLVRLGVEKAGEAGVPLTAFAEPGARDFFLHCGFEDVESADIDLAKWAPRGSGFGVFRLSGMVMSKYALGRFPAP
jgi:GNAT superfamily N-acetyltransferase